MPIVPAIFVPWVLVCFWATMSLAADPAPPSAVDAGPDGRPIPAERLVAAKSDGTTIPFDELLGDGRAVCFAFLHPACPLAQDYAPVLGELAARFAGDGIRVVGVVCECDDPAEVEA